MPRPTPRRAVAATLTATALAAATVAAASSSTAAPAGPAAPAAPAAAQAPDRTLRVATFNASLNRTAAGQLVRDLSTPDNAQARAVAEVIQRTNPDLLLVNEFDWVEGGVALDLFRDNYLERGQNGADPVQYPYAFAAPVNTGVPSGLDLDNSGTVGGPNDAFGFGFYPGQYGMAVFSKHPIDTDAVRTFQHLLWKDMPGALLPDDPATAAQADWYSPAELEQVRLSSKSHWDVPVEVGNRTVHFLVSHPTPPVFDGLEDRNGTRNHDEIRLWADYVGSPRGSAWITDDEGVGGGLAPGASFVIAGDQNSDPRDGDSIPGSAQLLLDHPRVNAGSTPTSEGAVEASAVQGGVNLTHLSPAAQDTADFSEPPGNLRADYVLPSRDLRILGSAVFWKPSSDPLSRLTTGFFPSDHRLVHLDVRVPGRP
ncbi:endonuclease/exonuclease/phosphatase family protein [Oryzobacter sp. R7]|uniref:endonuclease/exonuclease/phosphatase family protein n=1 Tax=Oryzobacter faecalis TaxID=3388656 RepID=UPI00398CEA8F